MMGCSAEAVCKRGKEGQVSGYNAGGEIVEASLLDIVQTAFPKRFFFSVGNASLLALGLPQGNFTHIFPEFPNLDLMEHIKIPVLSSF